MKKSQSPLVGSQKRRYQQRRAVRSNTFRRFRTAFAQEHGLPPVGNGPYRIAADNRQNGLLLRLSKTGILAGLLAVLLAMLVLRGWQLLEQSDAFRVRQITVQGCRALHEEQLLAWAELRQGVPLLKLRLPEAEQRLRQQPWIEQASIRRVWPDSLVVDVKERRPLALIKLEDQPELRYVDQNGMVFAAVEPGQDLDFPVITGISQADGPQIFSLADKGAAEAAQFLRLVAQGNPLLPLQALSEIHVSRDKGIIAYLAERPFPIYIGYGNIKTRYYQLVRLLERLYRKEKIEHVREIRMDYQAGRILVASLAP